MYVLDKRYTKKTNKKKYDEFFKFLLSIACFTLPQRKKWPSQALILLNGRHKHRSFDWYVNQPRQGEGGWWLPCRIKTQTNAVYRASRYCSFIFWAHFDSLVSLIRGRPDSSHNTGTFSVGCLITNFQRGCTPLGCQCRWKYLGWTRVNSEAKFNNRTDLFNQTPI